MVQTASGLITVVLLALYVYAIVCIVGAPTQEPTDAVATIVSIVGGLVSALVVTVLGLQAASVPTFRVMAIGGTAVPAAAVTFLKGAYFVTWLGSGGWLIATWMRVSNPSSALASAAKSWLGLAAAAASAYLGLQK